MKNIRYTGWLILIVLFACNNNKVIGPESSDKVEFNTSMIRLTGLNGQTVNLNQFKGKTLFMNFWATWCKPCLEEMPSIQKAIVILKNEKIEFVFVSDESTEEIQAFETEHNYGFFYTRAGNIEELNIIGLPTTYIFDKDGKQVFSEMGYRKWNDKANIDLLLKISKPE